MLEVDAVAARPCAGADGMDEVGPGTRPLVRALTHMPGLRVTEPPEQVTKFGHAATHIGMQATTSIRDCKGDFYLYDTARNGQIGVLSHNAPMDLWVVDVDGYPILVQAVWLPDSPQWAISQMLRVVDSIEFDFKE